ncbi:type IV pilus modification protein PilV [Noviherbaspirillum saxi]|uniref:type IV pilus modification protein PilV n=1 Tax=Noviherbaspirillum saxi TaxID=2320863 RepID=UPI001314878C|nr:type IV pilus modification protein PilV [Noviherbaspirillum saxi]
MVKQHTSGFSLVEVLVAVFILAIGVIGAAGMQLTAMRTNHQSGLQTMAVQLAAELADKMRANDGQMKKSDTDNPFVGLSYQRSIDGMPQSPSKLCYSVSCNSRELADFDVYEWKRRIASTLPDVRALVCRDSQPWDDAARALSWNCQPGAETGTSLVIKLGWQAKNSDGSLVKDAAKQFPPSVAFTVEPYVQ